MVVGAVFKSLGDPSLSAISSLSLARYPRATSFLPVSISLPSLQQSCICMSAPTAKNNCKLPNTLIFTILDMDAALEFESVQLLFNSFGKDIHDK